MRPGKRYIREGLACCSRSLSRLAGGHRLSAQEEKDAYKEIVQSISQLVGDAGVSIKVFADLDSRAEEMLAQGQEMFTWIPNAYVKYPCTYEGLRAAEMSVRHRTVDNKSRQTGFLR